MGATLAELHQSQATCDWTDGQRLVLEVVDTGAEIPAEEIPRMFGRFYRAPGIPARTDEGPGIGLSLA